MKKLLIATAACALMAGSAIAGGHAKEAKIGVILGFTGPIESLAPHMADSAELAFKEVNDSGKFLDGVTLAPCAQIAHVLMQRPLLLRLSVL
jgi:branched-chain amino acid transport system substrate-binding protein